jgi:hypothetical protein
LLLLLLLLLLVEPLAVSFVSVEGDSVGSVLLLLLLLPPLAVRNSMWASS